MIDQIHKSPCYGYIVETGAGAAISNYLMSYPGSSNTIEACFVPYSKEFVGNSLNVDVSKTRAVSKEYAHLLHGFALNDRTYNLMEEKGKNFFVLSSTFQIAADPNVSTHGWMAFITPSNKEEPNFYHFTLPPLGVGENILSYRNRMMYILSEIGSSVIYRNMISKIDLPYMDIIEEDGSDTHLEVIKSIVATRSDLGVVFLPNGETNRLESICRVPELLIFKGSFNPPHKAHLEMIKRAENNVGIKGYFSISIETFGKGISSPEDISHRIKMINELGYGVIINKKPLFSDFISLFNNRLNNDTNIHFIMGEDTVVRFIQSTPKDIEYSASKTENGEVVKHSCFYHVFKRSEGDLNLPENFKIYDFNMTTSSTYVRENLDLENLDETTKEYVMKNKLYGFKPKLKSKKAIVDAN